MICPIFIALLKSRELAKTDQRVVFLTRLQGEESPQRIARTEYDI